ncbi:GxxExxY, GxxExxY protein [Methylophilaceae bacterium]
MSNPHHRDTEAQRNALTQVVIGAAIEVHKHLGAGLLESAYEECLCFELAEKRIAFKRQVEVPVNYKGLHLDINYRIDLLVDGCLILELKSVDRLLPVHEAQLLTYMKLAKLDTGLLINFNVPVLKNGLKRMKL